MNVALIGDFSPGLDEGYKNTSHYLADWLSRHHTVLRLNAKEVGRQQFWRTVRGIKPQIVHTIAQPTHRSLLLTRLLRQRWPGARTVVSTLRADQYFPQSEVRLKHRLLLPVCRPDLILVHSAGARSLFTELGCRVGSLPNGVDLERFQPASPEQRHALRLKHGLDPDRPVILHVGHLVPERNLMSLARLPQTDIQVLVAGSVYMGVRHDLIAQLKWAGYHLLTGYQPQVEELYALSDLYVFPPRPGDSLGMPLSVLEAMACNLPVLTTRFSGLTGSFREGQGFRFVDDTDDLLLPVQEALASTEPVNTRAMVSNYSWAAVADQLHAYYEEMVRR